MNRAAGVHVPARADRRERVALRQVDRDGGRDGDAAVDVDADGVSSLPVVPPPPLLCDVVSAKLRSAATASSTPLPAAPPDDSPGAPAADAFAAAVELDALPAVSETAPVAVK